MSVSTSDIAQVVVNLILMVAAVIANGIVIVMFVKCRNLRIPANILIINLAWSNILLVLISPVVCADIILGGQFYDLVPCDVIGSLVSMSCITSTFLITAIALVRYVSIVHPSLKQAFLTWKILTAVACFIWVYTLLLLTPIYLGVSRMYYHTVSRICIIDWHYNITYTASITLLTFAIPFMLIGYCYLRIFIAYKSSRNRVTSQTVGAQNHGKVRTQDLRLAGQLLATFFVFSVCWLPYVSLVLLIDPQGHIAPQWLYDVSRMLIIVNPSVSPLLYWFLSTAHRRELSNMCCRRDSTLAKEDIVYDERCRISWERYDKNESRDR